MVAGPSILLHSIARRMHATLQPRLQNESLCLQGSRQAQVDSFGAAEAGPSGECKKGAMQLPVLNPRTIPCYTVLQSTTYTLILYYTI